MQREVGNLLTSSLQQKTRSYDINVNLDLHSEILMWNHLAYGHFKI